MNDGSANNTGDDVHALAQSMLDVLAGAPSVGHGVDAVGILLGFYLCRLRDSGVITACDAQYLAQDVHRKVMNEYLAQTLPDSSMAVH